MSDDGVYDDDHPSIQLASCFTDHISGIQATNQCNHLFEEVGCIRVKFSCKDL